jgi:hypothetical protein
LNPDDRTGSTFNARRGGAVAKKKNDEKEVDIEITPKDLANALEGIYQSVLAVKRLVLKLDANTVIRIKSRSSEISPRLWDTNCPPPE